MAKSQSVKIFFERTEKGIIIDERIQVLIKYLGTKSRMQALDQGFRHWSKIQGLIRDSGIGQGFRYWSRIQVLVKDSGVLVKVSGYGRETGTCC